MPSFSEVRRNSNALPSSSHLALFPHSKNQAPGNEATLYLAVLPTLSQWTPGKSNPRVAIMSVQSKTAAFFLQIDSILPACSLTWVIFQDAWLWMDKFPSSGGLHKCLLPQRKKKQQRLAIFCLRNEIFGYMAIGRDTWLLRTNVLRDLNSCLTAGGLIISSKWNFTEPSVLFLDLGWKKTNKQKNNNNNNNKNKNKKKKRQKTKCVRPTFSLNWDNFLGNWPGQSSLSEGLLKC